MVSRDHLVTLAREGSQQNRRPQSTPLLFGSRLAEGLQLAPFRFGKLQGIALPREGHTLLKHNLVRMYCYLKNDDLGGAKSGGVDLYDPVVLEKKFSWLFGRFGCPIRFTP